MTAAGPEAAASADAALDREEDAPRRPPASAAPVLMVAGFEGPLDWLLELARAQRIDLAKLSILDIVDAFLAALDGALSARSARADLASWSEWLVVAATFTLLRSRLLLPADAPEARRARDEAEAIRRQLLDRAAVRRAAEWLDRRPQLGRDVFGRGSDDGTPRAEQAGDITDLFRACLTALRVPDQLRADRPRQVTLWRVPDAIAQITRLMKALPDGGPLERFLPAIDEAGPDRDLRCRAAVAATMMGGLELARNGQIGLTQEAAWDEILLRGEF